MKILINDDLIYQSDKPLTLVIEPDNFSSDTSVKPTPPIADVKPKPEPIKPPTTNSNPTPPPSNDDGRKVYLEDIAEVQQQSEPDNIIIPKGLSSVLNVEYKGAFHVSKAKGSDWSVGTIGLNKDRNSLFLAGHAQRNTLAELKIPNEFSFTDDLADLPYAEVLQDHTSVLDKRTQGKQTNKITGLLCFGENLIINSEIWYDGSANNKDNMQVFSDSSDLKNTEFKGMLQLQGEAKAAGYMSKIPQDAQSLLNSKYMCGWASNYSITGRYSQGPSVYTFNPLEAIDSDLSVPTQVYQSYTLKTAMVDNPLSGGSNISPLWGALSRCVYACIISNTKILMCIGSHGGIHSGIGYKITQDNGHKTGGFATYKHLDNYNYFWLYDLNEIVKASEVYEPRPFSYGKWSLPFDDKGQHKIIGADYDQEKNLFYICLGGAGQQGKYDNVPLILTYEVKA